MMLSDLSRIRMRIGVGVETEVGDGWAEAVRMDGPRETKQDVG